MLPTIKVHHTADLLALSSDIGLAYCGTCVLGHGMGTTRSIINLRVVQNFTGERDTASFDPPDQTLRMAAERAGLPRPAIGMMTSASMDSYQQATEQHAALVCQAHVTAGLSNARAAGDAAEYVDPLIVRPHNGTINTILVLSHPLTPAAAIEGLLIATEAKALCLFDRRIMSKVSNRQATGTGTDSTVFLWPADDRTTPISYCGKHTVPGELIARSTYSALDASLSWYD